MMMPVEYVVAHSKPVVPIAKCLMNALWHLEIANIHFIYIVLINGPKPSLDHRAPCVELRGSQFQLKGTAEILECLRLHRFHHQPDHV